MKRLPLFAILICLLPLVSAAQHQAYTVEGGEDINKEVAPAQRFQYPGFTKGRIAFRDGKDIDASLNYNWVLGSMQFISPKDDTLSLAYEATIKYIVVNNDSFFYDNQYVQWMDGNGEVKLAKNEKLKLSSVKKIGAFDTRTSGVAVTTYSSVNVNNASHSLDAKEELTIKTTISYYLGDVYNHFVPFTKKNLLKRFAGNSRDIEDFLKNASPDFSKESDLLKLMSFLKEREK